MSEQSTVFPDSIDEVLTAVQETPRGRWFLEAYANRIKNDGTANILQAISKLENNLTTMTISGADASLLQQTRDAIAAAKREIASIEPKNQELSAEGQLFAKLADLSRAAFQSSPSGQTNVAKGVDRVLKLVTEIDNQLAGGQSIKETVTAKPASNYFKADEVIFEPAPPPVPAPVAAPVLIAVSKPEPIVEAPGRGAKLVIQRISRPSASAETETPLVSAAVLETPATESIAEPTVKSTTDSRIVIIRRKAEDMVEVPLLGEPEMESMTAA
jgi:hypothetical protein